VLSFRRLDLSLAITCTGSTRYGDFTLFMPHFKIDRKNKIMTAGMVFCKFYLISRFVFNFEILLIKPDSWREKYLSATPRIEISGQIRQWRTGRDESGISDFLI